MAWARFVHPAQICIKGRKQIAGKSPHVEGTHEAVVGIDTHDPLAGLQKRHREFAQLLHVPAIDRQSDTGRPVILATLPFQKTRKRMQRARQKNGIGKHQPLFVAELGEEFEVAIGDKQIVPIVAGNESID
ncbi:hypothetical protein D3C73_416760 [compost metagenome]